MLARMAGGKACRPQFVRIAEFFPGANFGGQAARAVAGEVPAAGLAWAAQGATAPPASSPKGRLATHSMAPASQLRIWRTGAAAGMGEMGEASRPQRQSKRDKGPREGAPTR
jgi:hypothetical protein